MADYNPAFPRDLSDIEIVVIDVDGVLTDGKQYIASSGEKYFKAFNSRDIRAMRELVSLGVRVILMTTDDWVGTVNFAARIGVEIEITRNKLERARELALPLCKTLFVGDDAWDVGLLGAVAYPFVTRNADPSATLVVQSLSAPEWRVLAVAGGNGVVADLVHNLHLHTNMEK